MSDSVPRIGSVLAVLSLCGVFAAAAAATDVRSIRADLDDGHYARAETAARALLAIVEASEGPDSEEVADVLDLLVEAIRQNGTFVAPDARGFAERAVLLREARFGPDAVEVAASVRNLADLLYLRAEYEDAERLYDRALTILDVEPTADRIELGRALSSSARLMAAWRGEYDVASAMFERAAEIVESEVGPDAPELALVLRRWGGILTGLGESDRAETTLRSALSILESHYGAEHPQTAMARLSLVRLLYRSGRWSDARDLLESVLVTLEATLGDRHPSYALALTEKGLFVRAVDAKPRDSVAILDRAIEILEASAGPEHPWLTAPLNHRANNYLALVELAKARADQERVLAIREKTLGPDHPDVAMSANNLGSLLQGAEDYAEAERYFLRASRIWERTYGPGHLYSEGVQVNLGMVRRLLGDLEGAEVHLTRALEGLSKASSPDHPYVGLAALELGRCKLAQGKDAEARDLLERAVAILEHGVATDRYELAYAMSALASLLEGDPAETARVRELRERVLSLRLEMFGPDHPMVAFSELGVARSAALEGDPEIARDLAVRAENVRRAHLRLTARLASERDALRFSWRGSTALDLLLSLTPDEGDAVAVAWDQTIRSRALVLEELARRQRDLDGVHDAEIDGLLDELESVRAHLVDLVLEGSSPSEPEDGDDPVASARAEMERLERTLAARASEYRDERRRRWIGLEDVREALPQDFALVAYVRYVRTEFPGLAATPGYLAFLLTSGDAQPVLVPLGDAASIERRIDDWMRELSTQPAAIAPAARKAEEACRVAGEAVRRSIWDPVARHLPDGRRVLVVPDGAIHMVSFNALPKIDGRYVLESGPEIHVLSSEKDLTIPQPERLGRGLLLVGDPDFDRPPGGPPEDATSDAVAVVRPKDVPEDPLAVRGTGGGDGDPRSVRFRALPGTRKEVETVLGVWRECARHSEVRCPGDVVELLGARADETLVKRAAQGKRVIHLATHGVLGTAAGRSADGPERVSEAIWTGPGTPVPLERNPLGLSALAFAGANRRDEAVAHRDDGLLTAAEVASLDLAGVEWAVLSGCETGRGAVLPGEGVLGFRRVLRLAGVRTVLMTLWPIEDEASRDWVRELYSARSQGASTSEAVRQASLHVLRARRASGESTHPFYWGAFVAEGDWR